MTLLVGITFVVALAVAIEWLVRWLVSDGPAARAAQDHALQDRALLRLEPEQRRFRSPEDPQVVRARCSSCAAADLCLKKRSLAAAHLTRCPYRRASGFEA